MASLSDHELRWLIGKIIVTGLTVDSRAEYLEIMTRVRVPDSLVGQVPEKDQSDAMLTWVRVALAAAHALYPHGSLEEANVRNRLDEMLDRIRTLPSVVETQPNDFNADPPKDPGRTHGNPTADSNVPISGDQHVQVARDVMAPIINAPGGSVTVNDRGEEVHTLLCDYPAFLVFVTLGVKKLHASTEVRTAVEDAISALVAYHREESITTTSNSPSRAQRAGQVYETVDTACRLVMGKSLEDARPELFEAPMPTFDLFGNMRLVPGGTDPYTRSGVRPFYLARYPVTVAEYSEFCRASGWPPVPEWQSMAPPSWAEKRPVTGVSLLDVVVYCLWLESATGFRFRLPTEAEWCFAATAGSRRDFPWGSTYGRGRAITSLESMDGPRDVDACPGGASPFGVLDLAGNVWELVSTLFSEDVTASGMDFDFPPIMSALGRREWWETDVRVPRGAGDWLEATRFVMKGGSWGGGPDWATMDRRIWTSMFNRGDYGGFRVACSVEPVGNGWVPTPSYLSPRVARLFNRFTFMDANSLEATAQSVRSGCCGVSSSYPMPVQTELMESAVGRYDKVGRVTRSEEHRVWPKTWLEVVASRGPHFPSLRN